MVLPEEKILVDQRRFQGHDLQRRDQLADLSRDIAVAENDIEHPGHQLDTVVVALAQHAIRRLLADLAQHRTPRRRRVRPAVGRGRHLLLQAVEIGQQRGIEIAACLLE